MDFPWLQAVILIISYALFPLATWIVWPSRWNVIAIYQAGFFFVAYFVPILFTRALQLAEPPYPTAAPAVLNLLTAIMASGAILYLVGVILGINLPRFTVLPKPASHRSDAFGDDALVRSRAVLISTLAVIGLYVSFPIMGYVPAFTANPLQAKYFHGAYRPGYLRAIWLYLPSFFAFVTYMPLFILLLSKRLYLRYVLILVAGFIAVALTLHRGDFGRPLILGVGFLMAASRMKHPARWFLVISVLAWSLGAMVNYGMALYFDIHTANIDKLEEPTLAHLIASGAPDVVENLQFLDGFLEHGEYTYGRNWVGGLIPLQPYWNPGLWSLSVALDVSHDDAINAPGGGLRLALPLIGFSCLDWPGVLVFSLTIGILTGYIVGYAKRHASSNAAVELKAIAVMVALALLDNLEGPTWQTLIPLIALTPLIRLDWFLYRLSALPPRQTQEVRVSTD